jgi:hypothetical protein
MALGQAFLSSIATEAVAVTKHDTNLNQYAYLYVGGAGDVVIDTEAGNTVTYVGVPAGAYIWVRTLRVKAATTATNIVGHR